MNEKLVDFLVLYNEQQKIPSFLRMIFFHQKELFQEIREN